MTVASLRRVFRGHKRKVPTGSTLPMARLALGLGAALQVFCTVGARAADIPIPVPSPGQNVVQFVNESNTPLLLAAFGPTAVEPREGIWLLRPGAFLTVDIPTAWQNTTAQGTAGPRFWARTGCHYDPVSNLAQCETGNWGGNYDAFKGSLRPFPTGVSPNTFTEWCFNCGNNFNFWDVSAVDGVDLSVDIQPLGEYSPDNPKAPGDAFWCKYPNSVRGADRRAGCPSDFQLKRSQLGSYIAGSEDHVVACFSNCGKYKYPLEPPATCTDETDPRCTAWKRYCCTAGPSEYDKDCTTDADCSFGDGCLELVNTMGQTIHKCQCRGWIVNPPCPESVCTNQDAGVPPFGTCSQAPGPLQCIGEDTMHEVLPRAFSWPNDPQTYDCDARIFRVTFAPGGSSVPISETGDIPLCSTLPEAYGYAAANSICSGVEGRVFAGARPSPQSWDCKVTATTNGVLCRWEAPAATAPCDCDGSGAVTVNELVESVAIVLGTRDVEACRPADVDTDGAVTVNEVVSGVDAALEG